MYQRQVSFQEAVKMALDKYCQFSGRASRSEFWWFALFTSLLSVVVQAVFGMIFGAQSTVTACVTGLVSLAFLLPSLGVFVRRLHDIGKAGGWIFLSLIPLVGGIILLIWMIKDSEPCDNRFGPVPNLVA